MKDNIKQIWGRYIEPYADKYNRITIYYTKNDKDQRAVFMNYDTNGGYDWKIVEDMAYRNNRLREREIGGLGERLNNKEIMIFE